MRGHIPGITPLLAIVAILGIIFGCSKEPVKLPAKEAPKVAPPTVPAVSKWCLRLFEKECRWLCRKTGEGEPKGYYCTVASPFDGDYLWTLFCNEKNCNLVTLVHEAKWSKTIPNPRFSAPIFSAKASFWEKLGG